MKKTTAGLTFAAVTGFGLLTAGPALAVDPAMASLPPYANCDEARADGRTNIPSTDPRFNPALDRDGDGIGCDEDQPPTPTPSPTTPMPSPTTAPPTMQPTSPGTPGGQVGPMPSGGANTGITQEPEESNAGVLALGGGLVLAAAAGGAFVVRRRVASQE